MHLSDLLNPPSDTNVRTEFPDCCDLPAQQYQCFELSQAPHAPMIEVLNHPQTGAMKVHFGLSAGLSGERKQPSPGVQCIIIDTQVSALRICMFDMLLHKIGRRAYAH